MAAPVSAPNLTPISVKVTSRLQELQFFLDYIKRAKRLLHQKIMRMLPRKKKVKRESLLRKHYLMKSHQQSDKNMPQSIKMIILILRIQLKQRTRKPLLL